MEAKLYRLTMPFDRSFFQELTQRGIKEARFMIQDERVDRYDSNRVAVLSAIDTENLVVIEARHLFFQGPKQSDDSKLAEKKIRDFVDDMAGESYIVKTGLWRA